MSYCSNPLYLIQSIVKSSNCGASATNSPTASLTALSTSSGILSRFSFKTLTVRSIPNNSFWELVASGTPSV